MIGTDRTYVIQERDRVLLRFLATFRVVDREQAKLTANFGSTTRVNVRLLAMYRMGLLNRFFIGNTGSSRKAIYAITQKGAAVADVEYRRVRFHENSLLGADLALGHQLHINATYLSLRSCPPDVQVGNWITFDEPLCSSIRLKPDGYFEYIAGLKRSAFVEVDMGTETRKVWRTKVQEYYRLATSDEFSRIFRQQQFRTLIVATTERRLEKILEVASQQTEKIFFGTTFEHIQRDSFWSPIWLRPGKAEMVSLLEKL